MVKMLKFNRFKFKIVLFLVLLSLALPVILASAGGVYNTFPFSLTYADHCSEDPEDFSCHESGSGNGEQEPECDEDVSYCQDDGDLIRKHGGYWNGEECVYDFSRVGSCGAGDGDGTREREPESNSCRDEEGSYCQEGELWYKEDSYRNDDGECIFNFRQAQESESRRVCGGSSGDEPGTFCDPEGGIDPDTWKFEGLDCQNSDPSQRGQLWSCQGQRFYAYADLCGGGNYVQPGECTLEPLGYSSCFPKQQGAVVCEVYDDSCSEGFDPITANCREPVQDECGIIELPETGDGSAVQTSRDVETDQSCQESNGDAYYCDAATCIYKTWGFDGSSCVPVFKTTNPSFCTNSCVDNRTRSGELPQDKDAACKAEFGNPVYYCDGAVCIGRTQAWNGSGCQEAWPRASPSLCPSSCKGEQVESGFVSEDEQCRASAGNQYYCDGSACFNKTQGWDGNECITVYERSNPRNCPNACIGNTEFSGETLEYKDLACKENIEPVYYCDGEVCMANTKGYNPQTQECIDVYPKVSANLCENSCKGNIESSGLIQEDAVCKYKFGTTQYFCDTGVCLAKTSGFDGQECVDVFLRADNQTSCPYSCAGYKDSSGLPITTTPETSPTPAPASEERRVGDECKYAQECEGGGSYQACHGTLNKEGNCVYREGTECSACQAQPPDLHPDNTNNKCVTGVCVEGPGPVCITDKNCEATKPGSACNFIQLCPEGSQKQACRGEANADGVCEYTDSVQGPSCTECTDKPINLTGRDAFCYLGACVDGPGAACLTNLDCAHTLPPPPPPQIAYTPILSTGSCYAKINCQVSGNEPDEYLTGYAVKYWVGISPEGNPVDCSYLPTGRVFSPSACPPDEPPSAMAEGWTGEKARGANAISAWAEVLGLSSPTCESGAVYCDSEGYINDVNGCIKKTKVESCINQNLRVKAQNEISSSFGNDVTIDSYLACKKSAEDAGGTFGYGANLTCEGVKLIDSNQCLPQGSTRVCAEVQAEAQVKQQQFDQLVAEQERIDKETNCSSTNTCNGSGEVISINSCIPEIEVNHGVGQHCLEWIQNCRRTEVCDFASNKIVSINMCSGEKNDTDKACPRDFIKDWQDPFKTDQGDGGIPVLSGLGNGLGWVKDRVGDVAGAIPGFFGGVWQGLSTNPIDLNNKIVEGNAELAQAINRPRINTAECQAYMDQHADQPFYNYRQDNNPCNRDATQAGTDALEKALALGSVNAGFTSLGINPNPETKTVTTGFCLGGTLSNVCYTQDTLLPTDEYSHVSQVWRLAEARKLAERLGISLYDEQGNPVDPNTWDPAKARLYFDAVARGELNPIKASLEGIIGAPVSAGEKKNTTIGICYEKYGDGCNVDLGDPAMFSALTDNDFNKLNGPASIIYANFIPSDPALVRKVARFLDPNSTDAFHDPDISDAPDDRKTAGFFDARTTQLRDYNDYLTVPKEQAAAELEISIDELDNALKTLNVYVQTARYINQQTPEGQLKSSMADEYQTDLAIGIATNAFDPIPATRFVAGAVKAALLSRVIAAPIREITQVGGRVIGRTVESIAERFAGRTAGETVEQLADRSITRIAAGQTPTTPEREFMEAFLREHSAQNSGRIDPAIVARLEADTAPGISIPREQLVRPISEGGYGLMPAHVDHLRDFTDLPVIAGPRKPASVQVDELVEGMNVRKTKAAANPLTRSQMTDIGFTNAQVDFLRDFVPDVPILGEKNPTRVLEDTLAGLRASATGRGQVQRALEAASGGTTARGGLRHGTSTVVMSDGALAQAPQAPQGGVLDRIGGWFDNTFFRPTRETQQQVAAGPGRVNPVAGVLDQTAAISSGARFSPADHNATLLRELPAQVDMRGQDVVDVRLILTHEGRLIPFSDSAPGKTVIARVTQQGNDKVIATVLAPEGLVSKQLDGLNSAVKTLPRQDLIRVVNQTEEVLDQIAKGRTVQDVSLPSSLKDWDSMQDVKANLALRSDPRIQSVLYSSENPDNITITLRTQQGKPIDVSIRSVYDDVSKGRTIDLEEAAKAALTPPTCGVSSTISNLSYLDQSPGVLAATTGICPGRQAVSFVGRLADNIPGVNLVKGALEAVDRGLGGRLSGLVDNYTSALDSSPLARPLQGALDRVLRTIDDTLPNWPFLNESEGSLLYRGYRLANIAPLEEYPFSVVRNNVDDIMNNLARNHLSPDTPDLAEALIADMLSAGHAPGKIEAEILAADTRRVILFGKPAEENTLDYIVTEAYMDSVGLPVNFRNALFALKYDSGLPKQVVNDLLLSDKSKDLPFIWARAIFTQESNLAWLKNSLESSSQVLEGLKNFAIKYGADERSFQHLSSATNPKHFHLVDLSEYSGSPLTAGMLMDFTDRQILIGAPHFGNNTVCTHECIHKAFSANYEVGLQTNELSNILGFGTVSKLKEGLTEWTTIYGLKLVGLPTGVERDLASFISPTSYSQAVRAIDKIRDQVAANLAKKGIKDAQKRADALMIEVALGGDYEKLFKAVGSDRGSGVITTKTILDQHVSDVFDDEPIFKQGELRRKLERLQQQGVGVTTLAGMIYGIYVVNEFVSKNNQSQLGGDDGVSEASPSVCNDEVRYCENGRLIHKRGGYWDGSECVYDFSIEGSCN